MLELGNVLAYGTCPINGKYNFLKITGLPKHQQLVFQCKNDLIYDSNKKITKMKYQKLSIGHVILDLSEELYYFPGGYKRICKW